MSNVFSCLEHDNPQELGFKVSEVSTPGRNYSIYFSQFKYRTTENIFLLVHKMGMQVGYLPSLHTL